MLLDLFLNFAAPVVMQVNYFHAHFDVRIARTGLLTVFPFHLTDCMQLTTFSRPNACRHSTAQHTHKKSDVIPLKEQG